MDAMLHVVRSHHGGMAIGASFAGRGLWIRREPVCHRWSILRVRAPKVLAGAGPDSDGQAPGGVREPRRPPPSAPTDDIALDLPPA